MRKSKFIRSYGTWYIALWSRNGGDNESNSRSKDCAFESTPKTSVG